MTDRLYCEQKVMTKTTGFLTRSILSWKIKSICLRFNMCFCWNEWKVFLPVTIISHEKQMELTWCCKVEFLDEDIILKVRIFLKVELDPVSWFNIFELLNLKLAEMFQAFLFFFIKDCWNLRVIHELKSREYHKILIKYLVCSRRLKNGKVYFDTISSSLNWIMRNNTLNSVTFPHRDIREPGWSQLTSFTIKNTTGYYENW